MVQLYVRDLVASVTRPMRQLLGWARVELDMGATATDDHRLRWRER
ncbi:fibronectin type III-like domain-contianing protein [Streptomyces sp. NPDC021212]